jgi:hypothetical protein
MAWTTPRTWVANETATAANLNTHVRDNLNALYGTDSTYTPTLSQGASTNIAKTVNEARYIQNGRIVDVWMVLSSTAAGTAGSNVTVSLPVAASGHLASAAVGHGYYYDQSANLIYNGLCRLASTTTVILYADQTNPATGAVGLAPALTVASGDSVALCLRYVVA